ISAGRDHDSARAQLAAGQAEHEAVALRIECGHLASVSHGGMERVRPALEVIDEGGTIHETVGLRARVFATWEPDAPVGRDEAKGIPAARAPGLGDPAGLEDHVIDAGLLEVPAGCQPGLPGPDDRDVNAFTHPRAILSCELSSPFKPRWLFPAQSGSTAACGGGGAGPGGGD